MGSAGYGSILARRFRRRQAAAAYQFCTRSALAAAALSLFRDALDSRLDTRQASLKRLAMARPEEADAQVPHGGRCCRRRYHVRIRAGLSDKADTAGRLVR